jgi:F0F1-type ATP synthase membrane subunit a
VVDLHRCLENDVFQMSGPLIFKIVVIVLLVIILASLASGMFFMIRDKGRSNRAVKSLTARIVLSIALFVTLFVGYATGLIQPHGVVPPQTEKAQQ